LMPAPGANTAPPSPATFHRWGTINMRISLGRGTRGGDLVEVGVGAVPDVLEDRPVEQDGVLGDVPDPPQATAAPQGEGAPDG